MLLVVQHELATKCIGVCCVRSLCCQLFDVHRPSVWRDPRGTNPLYNVTLKGTGGLETWTKDMKLKYAKIPQSQKRKKIFFYVNLSYFLTRKYDQNIGFFGICWNVSRQNWNKYVSVSRPPSVLNLHQSTYIYIYIYIHYIEYITTYLSPLCL